MAEEMLRPQLVYPDIHFAAYSRGGVYFPISVGR
jgi:hypothetical protein